MNTRSDSPSAMTGGGRLAAGAVGLILIGLFVTASRLTPDPDGLGTHEQLGLPPCTLRCLFNLRCPACGMTTAWSHALRGQLGMALRSNTAGVVLFFTALAAAPYLLISAARGRWLWRLPSDAVLAVAALTIAAITLVDWAVRLSLG